VGLDNIALSTRAIPVTNLNISLFLNATVINKDSSKNDELRHTTLSFVKVTVTCLSVVLELCNLQSKAMADAIRDTTMLKVEYSKLKEEILNFL
jgi:hypothetical protein